MKPDLIQISSEIMRVSKRLDNAPKAIFEAAREYAEAERVYRMELSKEITKLRAEGMSVSVIADVARGHCAEFKYERDLKEGIYRSSLESSKVLQSEMSGLQSILRYQDES